MAIKHSIQALIIVLIFNFDVSLCSDAKTCTLRNNSESKKGLLERLAPLHGHKFEYESNGVKYAVAICTNASVNYPNASVVKYQGSNTEALALYSDTDIVAGDSWLLLTYGNGSKNLTSNATRVQIVIMCNEETDDHPLHLIDESKDWGHVYLFELHSTALCPKPGLSNGSVFCIIFLTSLGTYLLVGIAYRRLIGGAKGFEQIPHYDFWKELGNLQADGCNFVCRRDMHREESWRRLTNNFNDPQDDALLRP